MIRLTYLAVLAGCLLLTLPLDRVLGLRVLARWRRLVLAVLPVAAVFGAWDGYAVARGQWWYDTGQTVGIALPHRIPLEEALFFLVVPTCSVIGFEAVRACTGWSCGDERATQRSRRSRK
ncbi:MAG: lycopene cyclase domain-containing protein [Mycobacteriales bacterium]